MTHLPPPHRPELSLRPLRLTLLTFIAALVTLSAGCLPVAWVTPPMEMAIGVGASAGIPDDNARITMPLSLTANPLQMIHGWGARRFDVGAGYSAHFLFVDPVAAHGPHLDISYIPLVRTEGGGTFGGTRAMRLITSARPAYRFAGDGVGRGPSLSLRLTLESVGFSDSVTSECQTRSDGSFFCGSYLAYGEDSYGLFIEATRGLTQPAYSAISIGLSFRIPATAGAGLMGQF
ncbi:hypothetical protein FRC98_12135 [Lujinxingia vulgaris]|uniref:Uncharacterized protein n=1 Tax=Lujinxingia vulgaris TaxID=2600176 RepID=A0A5C6XCS4_9DELT|nr:hypothetical protein [Lujinxingia vulgaris]TXD36579.1 hypothetical protein FRC98_12135 [Lujinxingia vulgaris]